MVDMHAGMVVEASIWVQEDGLEWIQSPNKGSLGARRGKPFTSDLPHAKAYIANQGGQRTYDF